MMPGNAIKAHVRVEERMKRLEKDACTLDINKVEYNDTSIGIITSGIPYQYVKKHYQMHQCLNLVWFIL